ncbi:hypothetical protein N806_28675 [Rhodococcus sp. P27]|nr:hypothetical protein N601_06975 [Rhodococcus erythropolis DN1]ERB55101.1 hypothetical protein N806_28675 [Rhodococcus sp. P27]
MIGWIPAVRDRLFLSGGFGVRMQYSARLHTTN